MRRGGDIWGRRGGGGVGGQRPLKHGMKGMAARLSVALIVLIICTLSLFSTMGVTRQSNRVEVVDVNKLWRSGNPGGWRPSSAPRSYWPPPPKESNGFLRVRCNGGLNQQRSAICNAVVAARIMNATLVLPELDTNSFWRDESGFPGIYDVEHFIEALRYDIHIVRSLPEVSSKGKTKKMKSYQIRPPRDAPLSWYTTFALEKMKEHSAIYLTPFSHRLAEEIDAPELQRLRCRVNYHALRFKPHIMKLSTEIVDKLRSQGHFMSIHLRFEMDMLAFAGCVDIFTPKEQKILIKYRKENFAEKELVYRERRLIGKCPLTPEEVGLILRCMGFDNTTRIYIAAGELFGGDRFMKPFRTMFPHLQNHSTVGPSEKLEENARGLVGSAVDYMVCLLSDIFMPTYDGPSNFANNLLGHRLYYGFRTTIQPNRKALAPIFMDREEGRAADFEDRIRQVMFNSKFGGPHKRVHPESFYTNSWPECFCQMSPKDPADKCPPDNIMETLDGQLQNEESDDLDPSNISFILSSLAQCLNQICGSNKELLHLGSIRKHIFLGCSKCCNIYFSNGLVPPLPFDVAAHPLFSLLMKATYKEVSLVRCPKGGEKGAAFDALEDSAHRLMAQRTQVYNKFGDRETAESVPYRRYFNQTQGENSRKITTNLNDDGNENSETTAKDIPPPANMAPFTPEAAEPRDAKPMKKDAGSFHRAGSPPGKPAAERTANDAPPSKKIAPEDTPGRVRTNPSDRAYGTPHHDVTVPPFAGWDENDPASGER
ncbi:hypothetical protein OPV22_031008 [Ensete ventricosum]|uniref:O-fucosyltransferase family protein n=1 Tax=Ensete ventricosum TaxID=4639 RepID=A0AAV8PSB4_ENSVE|nr:hypothetical protein OPV22_031008 [Ensete ventricosum]